MANALERKRRGELTPLEQQFAANVRARRLALGMTQEQLAEHIGKDRSFVGALERGAKNPSLSSVERYAGILGVRPIDLLLGDLTITIDEAQTRRAARSGDDAPPNARSVRRARRPQPPAP